MTDGNTIRSVAKAMELLQLLSDAGEAMTLTAISERAGLPKSTVFGLLTTMRDYDVITQHADGKYALGLRLFEYGCRASAFWNISSLARPYLEHLAEATGASAMLSTYENGHIVALDQAEGRGSLRIVSAPGARLPLHCTSQGKIVLACMSESEAATLLARVPLTPYTPHTETDAGTLLASLPAYLCRFTVRADTFSLEVFLGSVGSMSSSYFRITPHRVSAFRIRDLPPIQHTHLDALFQSRDHMPFCVAPSLKRLYPVQEFQPVVHRLCVSASA